MGEDGNDDVHTTQSDNSDFERTNGEADPQNDPLSIARDDLYHLLQSGRRRAVLRYLLAATDQESFDMRDVAEAVAAWENDATVETLTSTERQRVYISLYQAHLPKLDEHGIIEYNQSRGKIELTPLAGVLEAFLDVDAGLDAPQTIRVDAADTESTESASNSRAKRLLSTFRFDENRE